MQHHIQTLVKHFFQKDSLQEVSVNQLQQFVDDYPYSAVGQLLLAKKLGDTGAQNVEEVRAKASLYFHDPVWAGWFLTNKMETDISAFSEPATEDEQPHFVFNNIATGPAEAAATAENTDTPPWSEPATPKSQPDQQQPVVIEQPGAVNEFEPLREEPVIDQTSEAQCRPPLVPSREDETPEAPQPESADPLAQETTTHSKGLEQVLPDSINQDPGPGESTPHLSEQETIQPQTINQQSAPAEPETPNPKPETAPTRDPLNPTPVTGASTGDLTFEPYHTIDYFASLGIKLRPEEMGKDKLGQQLRSFTDWLRTMKRIGPKATEAETELDELTNKSIQRIAEFSNEAKEIITEAMAEVWAKQGHVEKAVEIYEKLSLLNPSKSSYFAARIEALKSR